MKEISNFARLKKNPKKTIITVLSNVHGLNHKSIKKIELLNGFIGIKIANISSKNFNQIFLQSQFFFNIEKNKIFYNLKKKIKMKNYTGMRHILKLPARGQRTHTNASTSKKYFKKEIL